MARASQFFRRIWQAAAAWKWSNFLATACPPGRRVVRINLDESSIPICPTPRPGLLAVADKKSFLATARATASHSKQRQRASLVALLSDDDAVQRLLPQFVVASHRVLSPTAATELQSRLSALSPRFRVFRRVSSWLSVKDLVRILHEVHASLQAISSGLHVLSFLTLRPSIVARRWRALANGSTSTCTLFLAA